MISLWSVCLSSRRHSPGEGLPLGYQHGCHFWLFLCLIVVVVVVVVVVVRVVFVVIVVAFVGIWSVSTLQNCPGKGLLGFQHGCFL